MKSLFMMLTSLNVLLKPYAIKICLYFYRNSLSFIITNCLIIGVLKSWYTDLFYKVNPFLSFYTLSVLPFLWLKIIKGVFKCKI